MFQKSDKLNDKLNLIIHHLAFYKIDATCEDSKHSLKHRYYSDNLIKFAII